MYLSTSTSTRDFSEMYLSTFQVLYKLYLSTDVLKYKVLLPGSAVYIYIYIQYQCHNAQSTAASDTTLYFNVIVSFDQLCNLYLTTHNISTNIINL